MLDCVKVFFDDATAVWLNVSFSKPGYSYSWNWSTTATAYTSLDDSSNSVHQLMHFGQLRVGVHGPDINCMHVVLHSVVHAASLLNLYFM